MLSLRGGRECAPQVHGQLSERFLQRVAAVLQNETRNLFVVRCADVQPVAPRDGRSLQWLQWPQVQLGLLDEMADEVATHGELEGYAGPLPWTPGLLQISAKHR